MTAPATAHEPNLCDEWAASGEAWAEIAALLEKNYAYPDRVADFDALLENAGRSASTAENLNDLATIAEKLGYAVRDGHFHVSPSPQPERAWIPSASDFWVARDDDGTFTVVDVRMGSSADRAGFRPGTRVTAVGGVVLDVASGELLAPVVGDPTGEQLAYAANVLLAGKLRTERTVTILDGSGERTITLPAGYSSLPERPAEPVSAFDDGGVVRFRFNNSLGADDDGNYPAIAAFDRLMLEHGGADAIILDLRDTPGGGDTVVLRAVLGHFVRTASAYQIHRNHWASAVHGVPREYVEYVQPRGTRYTGQLVVLSGLWTGSVGEALAVALSQVAGSHSIGTGQADLLGDLRQTTSQNGCLTVNLAWDRLYAPDGTAREDWLPAMQLPSADLDVDGSDPAMAAAKAYLAGLD